MYVVFNIHNIICRLCKSNKEFKKKIGIWLIIIFKNVLILLKYV